MRKLEHSGHESGYISWKIGLDNSRRCSKQKEIAKVKHHVDLEGDRCIALVTFALRVCKCEVVRAGIDVCFFQLQLSYTFYTCRVKLFRKYF